MRLETAEHPMMLAEPSLNTKAAREKMVELMFEKYNAPGELLPGQFLSYASPSLGPFSSCLARCSLPKC